NGATPKPLRRILPTHRLPSKKQYYPIFTRSLHPVFSISLHLSLSFHILLFSPVDVFTDRLPPFFHNHINLAFRKSASFFQIMPEIILVEIIITRRLDGKSFLTITAYFQTIEIESQILSGI